MNNTAIADLKRRLEDRLKDTKAKMYSIGLLGESLVRLERELNKRINELEGISLDDFTPEVKLKFENFEKESIAKETESIHSSFLLPVSRAISQVNGRILGLH
jgi:hypothetical protein